MQRALGVFSDFYPRSPCGERRVIPEVFHDGMLFLSTLSLRRATKTCITSKPKATYFYPRSPCGERRAMLYGVRGIALISIHALLAESDA